MKIERKTLTKYARCRGPNSNNTELEPGTEVIKFSHFTPSLAGKAAYFCLPCAKQILSKLQSEIENEVL